MDRLPLGSVRIFAVVARLLSITRAAEELNVTPSAVSHHIKLLELYLSAQLFSREKNKLALTPDGQEYLSHVSTALALLAGATRKLKTPTERLSLRIGTTPSFALLWLIPRLPRFSKAHPEIQLAVTGVPDPLMKQDQPFDLSVCYGSGGASGRITEPLGPSRVFPICKPSLATGESRLKSPHDLAKCTLLESADESYRRLEASQPSWAEWLNSAGVADLVPKKHLYFTPRALMQAAVASGLGVGLSRSLLAVDALAGNKLAVPFGPVLTHPNAYYVAYANHSSRSDIKAFRDWLHAEAATSTTKVERLLKKFMHAEKPAHA